MPDCSTEGCLFDVVPVVDNNRSDELTNLDRAGQLADGKATALRDWALGGRRRPRRHGAHEPGSRRQRCQPTVARGPRPASAGNADAFPPKIKHTATPRSRAVCERRLTPIRTVAPPQRASGAAPVQRCWAKVPRARAELFQQRVGRLCSGEGKNATYSPVAVGAHNAQPTTPTRRSTCARNRRCADVGASPILWSALGVSTTSHLSACRGVLDMFSEAVSPTSAPTIPFRRCVLAYVRWHGSRRGDMSTTRNGRTRRGSRGQARENADCADLRFVPTWWRIPRVRGHEKVPACGRV